MDSQEDFAKMLQVLSIDRMVRELDQMASYGLKLPLEQDQRVRTLRQKLPPMGAAPEDFARAEGKNHHEIAALRKLFPSWMAQLDHGPRSIDQLKRELSLCYSVLVVGSQKKQEDLWEQLAQWTTVERELFSSDSPPEVAQLITVDAAGLAYGSSAAVRDLLGRVVSALGVEPIVRQSDYLPLAHLTILEQLRGHIYELAERDNMPARRYIPVKYIFMVKNLEPQLGGWFFCNMRDDLWNTPGCKWVAFADEAGANSLLRQPPDFFDRELSLATGMVTAAHYSR